MRCEPGQSTTALSGNGVYQARAVVLPVPVGREGYEMMIDRPNETCNAVNISML
jgi:hypothetical protein